MPNQPPFSPLGAFLKALNEQEIRCILIGMMAAVRQGAPFTTIDYDFWVDLPERQYVRILAIIRRLGGTIMAPRFFELSDGLQLNVVYKPTGLRTFDTEYANSPLSHFEGCLLRVLPLERIIAKKAAGCEKDLAALPVLQRTLRLARQKSRRKVADKKRRKPD